MYSKAVGKLTEPRNGNVLVDAEAVGRLESRDLSVMELGEVFFAHAALFGVDLDGEGVDDFDVELHVLGDVQDHGRPGGLGVGVDLCEGHGEDCWVLQMTGD